MPSQNPGETRGIFLYKHNVKQTWVSHSNVTGPSEVSATLSTRSQTGQQAQKASPASVPHPPTQGKWKRI